LLRRLGFFLRVLERRFRFEFRRSPKQWLEGQRLQLARWVLKERRPVKVAAQYLGFITPSHFCHWFKQRTTLMPREFVGRCSWKLIQSWLSLPASVSGHYPPGTDVRMSRLGNPLPWRRRRLKC
jgi:AraC-like DNA-binding protein